MNAAFLLLPVICLILVGMAPSRWARQRQAMLSRWIPRLAGGLFAASLAAGPLLTLDARPLLQIAAKGGTVDLVYWNGVAWLMLSLVSFVGWIVARYSVRYLDGEATQGAFFCRLALTLGSVALSVIAGNLLIMAVALLGMSLGLHQLLLHYRQRPGAIEGARMKFILSRAGDVAFAAALVLTYREFGTLNLAELFEAMGARDALAVSGGATSAIGWLIVIGAAIKSAQFPFYFWLPETMETPTPVSALMHAGIVNAGGYVIIRLSPLVAAAPTALAALAAVGAVTALLGGVAMLAQTSVKRSLAYSTIAQMGFMMLQCGVGAFAAAMLHILAHSLYKAYAFLANGDVLTVAAAQEAAGSGDGAQASPTARFAFAVLIVGGSYFAVMAACGISPVTKPGGYLLGGLLCLGLTRRAWQMLASGSRQMAAVVTATTIGLCLVYATSYLAVAFTIAGDVPLVASSSHVLVVAALTGIAFIVALVWELRLEAAGSNAAPASLYVHASNGFYVEAIARRLLGSLST